MKTNRVASGWAALAIGVATIIAAGALGFRAKALPGQAPTASASAAPSASASAGGNAPPGRVLRASDVAPDPGPEPSRADWASAEQIAFNVSQGIEAMSCTAKVLHGWLRVACEPSIGVGLIAGDSRDVHTLATAPTFSQGLIDPDKAISLIEMPLRSGESKVFGFLGFDAEYNGISNNEGPIVQLTWRPGATGPTLIAIGNRAALRRQP
jgi:hypothetical protein